MRTEVKSLKKNVGNASPWVNRFCIRLLLHDFRPPSSVFREVSISSTSEEVQRLTTTADQVRSHEFPLVQLPKKFRAVWPRMSASPFKSFH